MFGPWRLDPHSPLRRETDGSITTMETRLEKTATTTAKTTPKNQLTFLSANNTVRAYKDVFDTLLRRSLHDSNVELMRHFKKEVDAPQRTPETLICISQLGEL